VRKNYKPLTILIAAALGIAFSASVMAADVSSKADYQAALKSAASDYKTALAACASGTAGHACRKDARATRDTAVDQARVKHGLDPVSLDENGAYIQPTK